MRKIVILFLITLLTVPGFGQSLDGSEKSKEIKIHTRKKAPSPPSVKFDLIDIEKTGTLKRPSQKYSYEGEELKTYKQFHSVIDPLDDPEASRLLSSAEHKAKTSTVFVVIGGVLFVGSVVDYLITTNSTTTTTTTVSGPFGGTLPVSNTTQPNYASFAFLVGGAVLGSLVGVVLEGDANSECLQSVTRYNHVVQPTEDVSMIFLPESPVPGLRYTWRF